MTDLIVTNEVSPGLVIALEGLKECIEEGIAPEFQKIIFKEGFKFNEDDDEWQKSFEGTVLFSALQNAWYSKPYDRNDPLPPNCMSSNSIKPDGGDMIQAKSCGKCPRNQFGSGSNGKGKACKNSRKLFIRLPGGLLPKVLSLPPTSMKAYEGYVVDLGSKGFPHSSHVMTKFEVHKQEKNQDYYNIRFITITGLEAQEYVDTKIIKNQLKEEMKNHGKESVNSECEDNQERTVVVKEVDEKTKTQPKRSARKSAK